MFTDSYEMARKKAKVAEDTSDLNTTDIEGDSSVLQRKKRRMIKREGEDDTLSL